MQMSSTSCPKLYLTYHGAGPQTKGRTFSFYLPVGGSRASCGALVVAYVHIGGHAAARVVVALETETNRFHHSERDGCVH